MTTDGALFSRRYAIEDGISGVATDSAGADVPVLAAAGAGIFQHLSHCSLSNTHASTSVMVSLKSGGAIRWRALVPPGGRELKFDPPLRQLNANENWSFDPDAAVVTLECAMNAIKSKV